VKNKDEDDKTRAEAEHAERKRRALELVAGKSPSDPAMKCRHCGAIIDSTAELSGDGKIRCNYCNQWTGIF
jgi:rubrerythrin